MRLVHVGAGYISPGIIPPGCDSHHYSLGRRHQAGFRQTVLREYVNEQNNELHTMLSPRTTGVNRAVSTATLAAPIDPNL